MHVTHLSLTNFRNYGRLELALPTGPTLLHGANAQGKTNLLEAIYYLATTRSPQAEQEQQLINWQAQESDEPIVVGRIVASLHTNSGPRQVEVRLILERNQRVAQNGWSFRREALVDRRKVRLMDLLGNLRVVLFLPTDLGLITGSPSQRRRYLDIILCQVDPLYCRTLSDYNKLLEQRNALLRQIGEGGATEETLPLYSERLVRLGSHLFARRAQFLQAISREAQRIHYEDLTDGEETVRLHYLPRLALNNAEPESAQALGDWLQTHQADSGRIEERYAAALAQAKAADLARGATNVGPHRDDWLFQLNGRSLSSFGSRGQQRTAMLGLKLAEINWMRQTTGDMPILLLDEVVAELDEYRRALLLNYVKEVNQALLTATDPAMFTQDFLRQATMYAVQNGRVLTSQP